MDIYKIAVEVIKSVKSSFSNGCCANELNSILGKAVMREIACVWKQCQNKSNETKRAYYFSAEFLIGSPIFNNLLCLGIYNSLKEILEAEGININILKQVKDPALGNGGLGRLAACFLDSAASLKLPLDGYGIRYRYGYFKQIIKDGFQVEDADFWLKYEDPWSMRVYEDAVTVQFKDEEVLAVPYYMPVIGYKNSNINTLRLWQCEPKNMFNFNAFNNFYYYKAFESVNSAQCISAMLYPNDESLQGKVLRLKQQYFFCSASLQDIIRRYKLVNGANFSCFSNKVSIQLNDTHPVISIAELVRLLCENESIDFKVAFSIARKVFAYTNHTVMSEALEKWAEDLVKDVIPNVYEYILKIQHEFYNDMKLLNVKKDVIKTANIIKDGYVHMANLAVYASSCTNGVSNIHTNILKNSCLSQWYNIYPERFKNVTNGITQRRWLLLCNPELSKFITELLNSDGWIKDLNMLENLKVIGKTPNLIKEFINIKQKKKAQLADYIKLKEGLNINTNTIFDVHIKRIHEYKRQLLNILAILHIYFNIKSGVIKNFTPTTFIFGGKAAPTYRRAKLIIKLINSVSNLIKRDKTISDIINIIFISNYDVSYAENIIPASDVSEQISTAGTEASGTGNMKFMLNGAVTLGTYDGANIEIFDQAGQGNNYIFGNNVEQLRILQESYNPLKIYKENNNIKQVLDALDSGLLGDKNIFSELKDSILKGAAWHKPDQYFILADFESFIKSKLKVNEDFRNNLKFYGKCFANLCAAGHFSSDRSVMEYAENIWHINSITKTNTF